MPDSAFGTLHVPDVPTVPEVPEVPNIPDMPDMPQHWFAPSDAALCAIPIEDGQLWFAARPALPLPHAELMARLIAETPWRQDAIRVYGKTHLQPRLCCWYGDAGAAYSYSGLQLVPQPWTDLLAQVRSAIEAVCGHGFNSVLLNYYRNQSDSMGLHSDDEPELGREPLIASLSLGATRRFVLCHKTRPELARRQFDLENGNLLLMGGALQQHWLHGIHKQQRSVGPRLNLTFRQIIMKP